MQTDVLEGPKCGVAANFGCWKKDYGSTRRCTAVFVEPIGTCVPFGLMRTSDPCVYIFVAETHDAHSAIVNIFFSFRLIYFPFWHYEIYTRFSVHEAERITAVLDPSASRHRGQARKRW